MDTRTWRSFSSPIIRFRGAFCEKMGCHGNQPASKIRKQAERTLGSYVQLGPLWPGPLSFPTVFPALDQVALQGPTKFDGVVCVFFCPVFFGVNFQSLFGFKTFCQKKIQLGSIFVPLSASQNHNFCWSLEWVESTSLLTVDLSKLAATMVVVVGWSWSRNTLWAVKKKGHRKL